MPAALLGGSELRDVGPARGNGGSHCQADDDETGEEQNDADETDYISGDGDDGDGEENKTPKNDNDDEKGKVINFSESIAKKKD